MTQVYWLNVNKSHITFFISSGLITRMKLRSFKDANLEGKRIFMRMDYNVPIENRMVLDLYKITSSFSTIIDVYKMNPKSIIIGTHLGRPDGFFNYDYSIVPIFYELKELISEHFDEVLVYVNDNRTFRDHKFVIIENLRFFPQEENKGNMTDPDFGFCLSDFFEKNVDVVVVDAFGCLHRDAYSITKTGKPTFAGNLVMKEIEVVTSVIKDKTDLLILGGCKISDKIQIIESLVCNCKSLFIVGGLTYTFLKYHFGKEVGRSVVDDDSKDTIERIYNLAKDYNIEIHLPEDFVVMVDNSIRVVDEIPSNGCAYDIGPKTIEKLRRIVKTHKKIFWNGTPGVFEDDAFNKGSESLVHILADHKSQGRVVVGGGETAACVRKFSSTDNFYHVSTGGGAFMKLLSGEVLPGVKALLDHNNEEL